ADGAVGAEAMLPCTPPRLSTITCCLKSSLSRGAMIRDTASVPPPGGAGTIQRIGRLGYVCAASAEPASADQPGTLAHAVRAKKAPCNLLLYFFISSPRLLLTVHMSIRARPELEIDRKSTRL